MSTYYVATDEYQSICWETVSKTEAGAVELAAEMLHRKKKDVTENGVCIAELSAGIVRYVQGFRTPDGENTKNRFHCQGCRHESSFPTCCDGCNNYLHGNSRAAEATSRLHSPSEGRK